MLTATDADGQEEATKENQASNGAVVPNSPVAKRKAVRKPLSPKTTLSLAEEPTDLNSLRRKSSFFSVDGLSSMVGVTVTYTCLVLTQFSCLREILDHRKR